MKLLIILTLAVAASALPVQDNMEGRVTNGEDAANGQFPYQVALFLKNSFVCGGSIISESYIMTAAHCVDGAASVEARMGSNRLADADVIRTVEKSNIILHSGWNPNTLVNDIALLKLDKALEFSSLVNAVQLASEESNNVGKEATVSGWGLTSDKSGSLAAILQFVNLPVISNGECAKTYGSMISSGQVCTATPNGQSICNGDSGSPLVESGVQIGIAALGMVRCEMGYPVAYTRVSTYRGWIKSTTGI